MPGTASAEDLRAEAEEAARHATRAHEAAGGLRAAAGRAGTRLQDASLVRAAARLYGIPTRHRQLKFVLENIADALASEVTRAQPGGGKTIAAFAPERQVRKWRDAGALPSGTYREIARTLALAGDDAAGPAERGLQIARCRLAGAYQGLLVEAVATALLDGTAPSLFSLPALERAEEMSEAALEYLG